MTPPGAAPTIARVLAGSLVVVGAVGALRGVGVTTGWGRPGEGSPAPATIVGAPMGGVGSATSGGPVAQGPSVARRPGPASRAPGSSPTRAAARWRWPLEHRAPVARPFRAPRSAWGAGHRGLDLTTPVGAPVLAVEDGRVTHAGVVAGRGTVSVEHRDGLVSTYEPVSPGVTVGDDVSAGQALG
ncbi:MAG TPA: peptidoglycan DD-metalloendopeptidase family protein, partial [Ornithinibacter sp.]|nr:peptidoglycan DD-metalloendopeptidase family protein [Ornithinibacter sp.]